MIRVGALMYSLSEIGERHFVVSFILRSHHSRERESEQDKNYVGAVIVVTTYEPFAPFLEFFIVFTF